jgi:hypothetical protein
MNPQGDPYRKKELDELMHFRKLMLIYRLVNYKDIITEIHIGIKRRNKELCKSYIQRLCKVKITNYCYDD